MEHKRVILGYRLRAYLKHGGIVAYPTESCFGLGCLPHHVVALKNLLKLKKRPAYKGLIVIGSSLTQLTSLLVRLPENTVQALSQQWPAPKTFLFPIKYSKIAKELRGRHHKLGVRVPEHAIARTLCYTAGSALVSTSANYAKKRPCRTEREVRQMFGKKVWIITGRIGQNKKPSQIIDWQSQKRVR